MEWLLLKIADLLGVEPARAGEAIVPQVRFEQPWPQAVCVFLVLGSAALIVWLYRREGRGLSLPIRVMFVVLRMVAILGVVVMLLEPVVVFEKSEFVPSTLLVLRDQSESMDLRDAFGSQPYAERLSQVLQLTGGANELREKTRSQLIDRALAGDLMKKLESGVSEDEKKLAEKDLQKVHDDFIGRIDALQKAKDAEIMAV